MATREGWLERETSGAVFHPWQRRYFLLQNNQLSWHSDPEHVGERGKSGRVPWDISKCVLTNRQDVENCFMIHNSEDGRTLLYAPPAPPPNCQATPLSRTCTQNHHETFVRIGLRRVRAPNEEEKRRWMEALQPLHYGSSTFDVITRHVCDAVLANMSAEVPDHPHLERFSGGTHLLHACAPGGKI
jgi:hypothetical protein